LPIQEQTKRSDEIHQQTFCLFKLVFFQFGKVHGKGAVQKMGPFTERYDNQCPLHQHSEVNHIQPFVRFNNIQIDKQTNKESGEAH